MMIQKRSLVLLSSLASVVSMMVGVSAFAGTDTDPTKSYTITWDDFKYRCSDAKDKPLNEQGKPEHIRVQCTNVEREFVPDAPGTVELGAARQVMTSVISDKFDVSVTAKEYPAAAKPGSCLRYKEVEKNIQIEKSLNCADVLSIKGDLNDYCASALDMAKGTSPKLIEVRDTGNFKDTCGGTTGGKK